MTASDGPGVPVEVEHLDPEAVLSAYAETEVQLRMVERRRWELARQWARLHPADVEDIARGRVEVAGGDGTPAVEEFAAEPLAAAIGASPGSARQLLGDALDLVHRHPLLWARVERLEVPVWRARPPTTWPHSADTTTGRRPDDDGVTTASPTGPISGRAPRATSTSSTSSAPIGSRPWRHDAPRGHDRGMPQSRTEPTTEQAREHPRLLHTVLDTTDVRGLAEFYRELLGLRYRPGDETPEEGEDWLVLTDHDDHRVLAFQLEPELTPTTWPRHEVPMQLHLDFTVSDRDALEDNRRRAEELGATILLDRTDEEDEPLYVFADPAGHPFCIFVG